MAELYRNLTFGSLGVSPSAPSAGSIAESLPAVFGWIGAAAWAHAVFPKDEGARPPASFDVLAACTGVSGSVGGVSDTGPTNDERRRRQWLQHSPPSFGHSALARV